MTSVVRPVVREIVRAVSRGVVRDSSIIRNLINFRAVMQSHIAINQIASGQSVMMDVYPTSGNTGLPPGAPSVTNNQWQTLTFTLTAAMDYIGRNGSDYFNGFIKNVNVSGRTYPLDDTLINSNVIRNSAATLGSELAPGSKLIGSGFTDNGDGSYTHTSTSFGEFRLLNNDSTLVDEMQYVIELTKTASGALTVQIGGGADSSSQTVTGAGAHEISIPAGGLTTVDGVRFLSNIDGEVVSAISIKEAPSYGTAFGLGAGDSEPYTLLTGTGYLQVANNYTGGALSGTVNTTVSNLVSGGVYRMILSNPTNADITFTSGANSVVIFAGSTQADLTLAADNVVITGSGVTTAFTPRVSRLLELAP